MKIKICPFCKNKAEIKPLLDPYKEEKQKNRLRLYEYACGTTGCYLEFGYGNYVEKENIKVLEDMWKNIPDYVSKIPKVKKGGFYTHYTPSGRQKGIVCCQRSMAKNWSDDRSKINCVRCLDTKVFKSSS